MAATDPIRDKKQFKVLATYFWKKDKSAIIHLLSWGPIQPLGSAIYFV